MKTSKLFVSFLVVATFMFCTEIKAQSSGIAADKQKQENLEKNKARQAELKKKYNSLTPEQAAEAKKRANEYKSGGYKESTGKGAKTNANTAPSTKSAVKSTVHSAAESAKPVINQAKPAPVKLAAQGTTTKPAPIFLDANGKPVEKKAAPSTPANKTVLKTPTPPQTPAEKAPTTETKKK
jgi:hypothetical protein